MAEDGRKGWGCALSVIGILVTAVGTLWSMVNVDYLRYTACSAPQVQGATAPVGYCRGFRPVRAAEAEAFYDRFLGRAAGAQPDRAWGMLSERARGASDLERFEAEWAGTLWAERVGVAAPTDDRNRYRMQYRAFLGQGNEAAAGELVYFSQDVEFADAGADVQIEQLTPQDRDGESSVAYARLELARTATTYLLPGTDQQPVREWPAGGGFRMLCSTEVGGQWWARTPLGWVSGDDVVDRPGGIACEGHHAQRVLSGRSDVGVVPVQPGD